eukprot:TRINITY_DN2963_c1_g2_i1.p1 TRINITY_DN2963_c1_g2~~TRINITY_DN2963_c1_g2_i1.p1  ORF type:complete len:789 (-),score=134.59 TRINITY_DN2963_c1_g2_i1:335-2701(-)
MWKPEMSQHGAKQALPAVQRKPSPRGFSGTVAGQDAQSTDLGNAANEELCSIESPRIAVTAPGIEERQDGLGPDSTHSVSPRSAGLPRLGCHGPEWSTERPYTLSPPGPPQLPTGSGKAGVLSPSELTIGEHGNSLEILLTSINNQLQSLSEVPQQLSMVLMALANQSGSQTPSGRAQDGQTLLSRLQCERAGRTHTNSSNASSSLKSVHAALQVSSPIWRSMASRAGACSPSPRAGAQADDVSPPYQQQQRRPSTHSQHSSGGRRPSSQSVYSNSLGCVLPNLVEDVKASNKEKENESEFSSGSESEDSKHDESGNAFSLKVGEQHGSSTQSAVPFSLLQRSPTTSGMNFVANHSRTLSPIGPARTCWNVIMLLLTMMIGITIPVWFVYVDSAQRYFDFSGRDWCFFIVDIFLWIDVVINFRTGYMQGETVVGDPVRIAVRYCRSWMLPNLLAAWPCAVTIGGYDMRALKLLRILELEALFWRLQSGLMFFRVTPLKILVHLLLAAHFMACAWRLCLRADAVSESVGDSSFALYIADLYWVAMTMTTIGYGDISPISTFSRLFAISCMLLGSVFFGFVITLLSHALKHAVEDSSVVALRDARSFLQARHVHPDIQARVECSLKHFFLEAKMQKQRSFLTKLSQGVQRDLSFELLRSVILRFPLFRDAPRAFVAELANAYEWVNAAVDDLIVEEGQLVQEVVFIVNGRVAMFPGADSAFANEWELSAGSWFGENALFEKNSTRNITAIAVLESELAVLSAVDYARIVARHPRVATRNEQIASALSSGS